MRITGPLSADACGVSIVITGPAASHGGVAVAETGIAVAGTVQESGPHTMPKAGAEPVLTAV